MDNVQHFNICSSLPLTPYNSYSPYVHISPRKSLHKNSPHHFISVSRSEIPDINFRNWVYWQGLSKSLLAASARISRWHSRTKQKNQMDKHAQYKTSAALTPTSPSSNALCSHNEALGAQPCRNKYYISCGINFNKKFKTKKSWECGLTTIFSVRKH
jgi:hypothetical protein